MGVMVEFQASQLARAAADVAGYLALADVHLTMADIAITPETTLADLTAVEATYDGYAVQDIVWLTPSVADDGTVEVNSTPLIFAATGSVVQNNIYAAYITEAAGTPLLFAGPLDGAPLPMTGTTSQIILTFRYRPASQTLSVVIS